MNDTAVCCNLHVHALYRGDRIASEDSWVIANTLSEAAMSFIRWEVGRSGQQMIVNSRRTKLILHQDKE